MTQPAGTQPAATAPADAAGLKDPKAEAQERHKGVDPRWRQAQDAQRKAMQSHWTQMPVVQTFKSDALVRFSLAGERIEVKTTDLSSQGSIRIAVEGSNATWALMHPRQMAAPGGALFPTFVNLMRFDFDAIDEDPWQMNLTYSNGNLSMMALGMFGRVTLTQIPAQTTLQATEFVQFGQPAKILFSAQAPSLTQLRAEHPEEVRLYVLPLLSAFGNTAFLTPGPGDVYSVFSEIAADEKVLAELRDIIPNLDADDPIERESASAKLRQLGNAGVLAALRLDTRECSEEQKLRLGAFVAAAQRRHAANPDAIRKDRAFLIDCLEFDDVAVRRAARTELQRHTRGPIDFDPELAPNAAAKSVDELRKRLLVTAPAPSTAPATQPAPQS